MAQIKNSSASINEPLIQLQYGEASDFTEVKLLFFARISVLFIKEKVRSEVHSFVIIDLSF